MDRSGTGHGIGSGRALVPIDRAGQAPRAVGGRPMAPFLTQLIVGGDPALRTSRLDRTREATALYSAQAARRG